MQPLWFIPFIRPPIFPPTPPILPWSNYELDRGMIMIKELIDNQGPVFSDLFVTCILQQISLIMSFTSFVGLTRDQRYGLIILASKMCSGSKGNWNNDFINTIKTFLSKTRNEKCVTCVLQHIEQNYDPVEFMTKMKMILNQSIGLCKC